MIKKSIYILIIFILTCCDQLYKTESTDFFYVEHKDALFPVMVSGKLSSETYIIFLHGGPGESSFIYHYADIIETLESEFAMVYWDQRGSGSCQGNSSPDLLTLEQYTEDTDIIIDVIRAKYNKPSIFLIGHSWGGCLGTSYLLDIDHQSKISGWIEVNGAHDFVRANELSVEKVKEYANEKISSGDDEWLTILKWYENHPDLGLEELMTHDLYVDKAFGSLTESESVTIDETTSTLFSPSNFTQTMFNSNYIQTHMDFIDISLTSELGKITVPTLILWGEHDYFFPKELAQEAYDKIGTIQEDKYLCILSNSGHTPVDSDKTEFISQIVQFVNLYR